MTDDAVDAALGWCPDCGSNQSEIIDGYRVCINCKPMKPLTDTDPMPFGKHRGEPMQDVPASYLHYLWSNGMKEDKQSNVADYIRRNLSALRQEHTDGIW